MIYCIVPGELAPSLYETLSRFYRDDPSVEVVVERRGSLRRRLGERRGGSPGGPAGEDRRLIRNAGGRRVGDRRAVAATVDRLGLPRKARPYADRLVFVERVEPSAEHAEDLDTARLVTRIQGGDRDAFADLYSRYFDRVYGYFRLALRSQHEAEDATQQVFLKVLEALPGYERLESPFRGWLFTIVRRHALGQLERSQRVDVIDPAELSRRAEPGRGEQELELLGWLSDRDLLLFIERLPLPQRQVLVLRYMLDLSHAEIAAVLERSHESVRTLHHRALRFLEDRLVALGRSPRLARRDRSRAALRQAPVLRTRRFALTPPVAPMMGFSRRR